MDDAATITAYRNGLSVAGITDAILLRGLLQSVDKDQPFVAGENNYVWFYAIAKHFRPKRILEFGTRFGYSLKCFVDGAAHTVAEYDLHCVEGERDGIQVIPTCMAYFAKFYPGIKLKITREDTEKLTHPPATSVDLCFVDANHTEQGCLHECTLGWTSLRVGGVLVVDDLDNTAVRQGLHRFCHENNLTFHELPALRQTAFIRKE